MSAKPIEQISTHAGEWSERRKRVRIKVRWPIWFSKDGLKEPVEIETSDLSSGGFYFLTKEPFESGEYRVCTLGMPANEPWGVDHFLFVECKVQVVRIQPDRDGLSGVGCRIQDYRFVETPNGPARWNNGASERINRPSQRVRTSAASLEGY
jgi:hypothetical protein